MAEMRNLILFSSRPHQASRGMEDRAKEIAEVGGYISRRGAEEQFGIGKPRAGEIGFESDFTPPPPQSRAQDCRCRA
jgi:hypothetical protein